MQDTPGGAALSAAKRPGSIKEASAENKVHPDTIRRRIASGEIRAWKLGYRLIRVDLDEVAELFRQIPTVRADDVAS
jgi:excisionase family DNA binding protein